MEMAQLALQAGVPAEAKDVVDKGYDAAASSAPAPEAERHQRLRDLIAKNLAEIAEEPRQGREPTRSPPRTATTS